MTAAPDNLEILARAIAENLWRRSREIGARASRRYGAHPTWEQLEDHDRVSYRQHARQILQALRGAGPNLDDAHICRVMARALYTQIWAVITAEGHAHPGLRFTPRWEAELPDHRGDYLNIAAGIMRDVRTARVAPAGLPQARAAA